MKNYYFILFMFFPIGLWGQQEIYIDLDNDSLMDTIKFDSESYLISGQLSSQNYKIIEGEPMESHGHNAYIEKSEHGFRFLYNAMRAGYAIEFGYEKEAANIRLVGMDRYEFGSANNNGSGESSLDLLNGQYLGEWNYYDILRDTLIEIPRINTTLDFPPIYLDGPYSIDSMHAAYVDQCVELYHLHKKKRQNKEVDEIKQQLELVAEWGPDLFDIDSLLLVMGKKIVKELDRGPMKVDSTFQNFDKISSKDSLIYLYSIDYDSHGTRGRVNNPIIQWEKSYYTYGAYELFPANKKGFEGIEMGFYEIYKLPSSKDLYLLLGNEEGSGIVYFSMALLIQIKNDYLILDYPAFDYGRPILNVSNQSLHYSEEDQTLTISETDGNGDEKVITTLQFNGNKFVKKK